MTRATVNRLTAPVPFILSGLALAIALGSIIAGIGREGDEGLQAHLWQLLMAAQFPVIVAFALTADWQAPGRLVKRFALYAGAFVTALAPVAIAGL